MRRGELLKLKWEDIDYNLDRINIHDTKSKKNRSIPLNDNVRKVLELLPKVCDNVFTYKGRPLVDPRASFKKALSEVEIENFRFHDLRHTFGTWLAMKGVDLLTIKELLGHSSIKMVERYAHISNKHMASAVKMLGTIVTHQDI